MTEINFDLKRVNLGSGKFPIEGFINVDAVKEHHPDVCMDVIEYLESLDNESINFFYCGHLLEHLEISDIAKFVVLVKRKLAAGGQIEITVPDITRATKLFKDGVISVETYTGAVFGEKTNPFEFHKFAFDEDILLKIFTSLFNSYEKIYWSRYWVADVPWQICYRFTKNLKD